MGGGFLKRGSLDNQYERKEGGYNRGGGKRVHFPMRGFSDMYSKIYGPSAVLEPVFKIIIVFKTYFYLFFILIYFRMHVYRLYQHLKILLNIYTKQE